MEGSKISMGVFDNYAMVSSLLLILFNNQHFLFSIFSIKHMNDLSQLFLSFISNLINALTLSYHMYSSSNILIKLSITSIISNLPRNQQKKFHHCIFLLEKGRQGPLQPRTKQASKLKQL